MEKNICKELNYPNLTNASQGGILPCTEIPQETAAFIQTGGFSTMWHCIIPFFYGENQFVARKGGSPVRKKIAYLRATIDSIYRVLNSPVVHVFVCNSQTRTILGKMDRIEIHQIECHPRELPYRTVEYAAQTLSHKCDPRDVVLFTEDDQVLNIAPSVLQDIQEHGDCHIFSPHRWTRAFLWSGRKRGVPFLHNGKKGAIDNYDTEGRDLSVFAWNHHYREERGWGSAYAACWAFHAGSLQRIDYAVAQADIVLESGSSALFGKGYPCLKLDLPARENPSDFLAEHLSGYDFNKRVIYLKQKGRSKDK
jgi:hypothetical protein